MTTDEPHPTLFPVLGPRHGQGDHRRCDEALCEVAADLHPAARRVAREALRAALGADHVVVCTHCGDGLPRVIATARGGWAATGARNDHVRSHGWYDGPNGVDYVTWKSRCFMVYRGQIC